MTTTMAKGDFWYEDFFKGRKRACKSKAVPGSIILKKKRNREECSDDLKLDSSLLRFESVTLAEADCAEERGRICESIQRRCRGAGVIVGCGRADSYEKSRTINRGAFGAVFMARDRRSGEVVAVKEEFERVSLPTLREIDILNSLPPHPSIVGFKEAVADDAGNVSVVMEHVDHDLREYMELAPEWDERVIKKLMKQLLEGVEFLHQNKVMHRDIKPDNILVSCWGELKICDFGLSRRLDAAGARYSPEIGTPGYRAPEMLQGEKAYTTAVDLWGVGCVMAEMVLNEALFDGSESESRQLETIDEILGGDGDELRKKIISSGFGQFSEEGFDILSSLLRCDATKRITAISAINHVWFKDL